MIQYETSTSPFYSHDTHSSQTLPKSSLYPSSFPLFDNQHSNSCPEHVRLSKTTSLWAASSECHRQQQDGEPNLGNYGSGSSSRLPGLVFAIVMLLSFAILTIVVSEGLAWRNERAARAPVRIESFLRFESGLV
jgi:hypothetical protein